MSTLLRWQPYPGKTYLIPLTPTGVLQGAVRAIARSTTWGRVLTKLHPLEVVVALAEELLRRPGISRRYRHYALRLAPTTCCLCAGRGVRIVGTRTFCQQHLPEAREARHTYEQIQEVKDADWQQRRSTRDQQLRRRERLRQMRAPSER